MLIGKQIVIVSRQTVWNLLKQKSRNNIWSNSLISGYYLSNTKALIYIDEFPYVCATLFTVVILEKIQSYWQKNKYVIFRYSEIILGFKNQMNMGRNNSTVVRVLLAYSQPRFDLQHHPWSMSPFGVMYKHKAKGKPPFKAGMTLEQKPTT